jgi:aminopeptidase N
MTWLELQTEPVPKAVTKLIFLGSVVNIMKFTFLAAMILVLLFCVVGNSSAHSGKRICSRAALSGGSPALWPDYPHRPYDVLKYQLTLDWRKMFETKSQRYSGVNSITIMVTDSTPNITLDAGLLKIDTISINGTRVSITPQPTADEKLIIPLPSNLQTPGNNIILRIAFHKDTLVNLGIYFYPKGLFVGMLHGDSVVVDQDLAYTMSEPIDAHYWMPCNDQPYEKAESEISIIVPNGVEAASNGTLTSKQSYTPASTIWNWKSDKPIATYLMVADASTFVHWSETHQRTQTPGDTVHLDYYAWPSDYYQDSITDGSWYNARYFLSRNTSAIMTNLESRYGGFPFVKYGQVPVQPFNEGGMEHQTLTTISRSWLRGDDEGIAHEMSHQWFGDKTTCETFKDIWLNEGFATFSEAIWGEGQGGNDFYMYIIRAKADGYFNGDNTNAAYDPPANNVFNYATTYCKGACILHMLRRMVGDSMFFGALRDYSNAFAFTTANTAQFRDYAGQRLGMDLNEYIDQWIFGALHPVYDIKWAQNANHTLFVRINQVQTVRDHFTMPLHFFAYHGTVKDTLSFSNNQRSQAFLQDLNYTIDSLGFDDDAFPLCIYFGASGDSSYSFDANLTQLYHQTVLSHRILPLPYAPQLAVHSTSASNAEFSVYTSREELSCRFSTTKQTGMIELYNSIGMKIQEIAILAGESLKNLNISQLSSGVYFVRFTSGAVNAIQSVNIVK